MDPASPLAPFPWLDVGIILFLVALNGVFAMSELAIVSARRGAISRAARAHPSISMRWNVCSDGAIDQSLAAHSTR
jgi:CBS domain containing-hemolysin-like protein